MFIKRDINNGKYNKKLNQMRKLWEADSYSFTEMEFLRDWWN